VRGDALPAPIAKLPIVGVAAGAFGAVGLLVAGARVDDGEVAKNADQHIMLADILDGGAAADLCKESLAVNKAAIGIGVEKIRREVGIKLGDIGFIHGSDVVAVELL
jgi:hypothetical protein